MTTRKILLGSLFLITLCGFRDSGIPENASIKNLTRFPERSNVGPSDNEPWVRSCPTVRKRFFHPDPEGEVYILVIKSSYELQVFDKQGWYATYPAVFGNKSLEDKMVQGDRKTPEGIYHIISKRPHEKWDKIMDLDYPTAADLAKFKERKAKGLIPRSAKPGDGIAIHGTWPHDEMTVDNYQNWTNGCVSLKCEDMDELYSIAPIGTKVIIQH